MDSVMTGCVKEVVRLGFSREALDRLLFARRVGVFSHQEFQSMMSLGLKMVLGQREDFRFCPNCGYSEPGPEGVICPNCGQVMGAP